MRFYDKFTKINTSIPALTKIDEGQNQSKQINENKHSNISFFGLGRPKNKEKLPHLSPIS